MSTAFKFTDTAPSDQLITDIQQLNAFSSDEMLREFITVSLLSLSSASRQTYETKLEAFAETNGIKLKALRNTSRGVIFFFNQAIGRNLGGQQISQDLEQLGLKTDKASLLAEVWIAQYGALSSARIQNTLKYNNLVDMEWKFGVTASSDEVDSIGACFLQLKLTINTGGDNNEVVVMELSLAQFYAFLKEMQAASAVCNYHSK
jgi:hypothetical protein